MTPKVRTAQALAHALLAGPADHGSAMERCARVLDQHPPWLTYLVRSIRQRFKNEWNSGSLAAMTATILRLPSYQRAWLSERPPRVRRPNLSSPSMAPRPRALSDCTPPDLTSVGTIADWLELPAQRLEWLTGMGFRDDGQDVEAFRHYQYRWLEKRSGGRRLLEVPKPQLRSIQRRILHELLEHIPPHEAAQGFRKGRSCLGNAELHVGQKIVLHFDLQDFFLHVRGARVAGLFRTLGYPQQVTRVLTGLCTHRAPSSVIAAAGCDYPSQRDWELGKRYQAFHLPQGAPTSPYLANLCAFGLDVRLHGLAKHLGGNYSRYADDLVFSGGDDMARAVERLMPLVGAIALDEGFMLNHRKTRVMRQSTRQIVTGIVVNQRPNLLRTEYDALKATLFNCARDGAHRQNLAGHQDFQAHLLGKIASVRHIHTQKGERLMEIFRRIVWYEPA